MSDLEFPGTEWETANPGDVGFDRAKLEAVGEWRRKHAADRPFRLLVVRNGRVAGEWWGGGVGPNDRQPLRSASKSSFSCALGIAVADGVIGSADDMVVDYYPEMMDVPPERGPKDGRYAFPENIGITFRQLIANTSGYMKPGEPPGEKFHYQTFGMNILCHAIAAKYKLYATSNPVGSPGIGQIIETKIRDPIGGSWTHETSNFDLRPGAAVEIFGYQTFLLSTARDMARMGLLWLNFGSWNGLQVVPADWLEEATRVSDMVKLHEPPKTRQYGLGFWCNDEGGCWPDLPRDSFAAIGAGNQLIWVCPPEDLVVVQSPGTQSGEQPTIAAYSEAPRRVLAALVDGVA